MRRTLLPRLSMDTIATLLAALMSICVVVLMVIGVAQLNEPAGWITAAAGVAVLEWRFFGGQ